MPEISPILQTIDLTKSFGMVKAADAINVHITRGECVGIVGANGSGKTTFLNLITGYLQPDHGRILCAEQAPFTERRGPHDFPFGTASRDRRYRQRSGLVSDPALQVRG